MVKCGKKIVLSILQCKNALNFVTKILALWPITLFDIEQSVKKALNGTNTDPDPSILPTLGKNVDNSRDLTLIGSSFVQKFQNDFHPCFSGSFDISLSYIIELKCSKKNLHSLLPFSVIVPDCVRQLKRSKQKNSMSCPKTKAVTGFTQPEFHREVLISFGEAFSH